MEANPTEHDGLEPYQAAYRSEIGADASLDEIDALYCGEWGGTLVEWALANSEWQQAEDDEQAFEWLVVAYNSHDQAGEYVFDSPDPHRHTYRNCERVSTETRQELRDLAGLDCSLWPELDAID